jgi:hypothetical protein
MNSGLVVIQNRDVGELSGPVVPVVVAASGADAVNRFLNFFGPQIPNANTRAAYLHAAREFLAWCERHELNVSPVSCRPTATSSMIRPPRRSGIT